MTEINTPERLRQIGGSEAAAVLGLSPFESRLTLYMRKRGELPPFEGNEFTEAGSRFEEAICLWLEDKLGLDLAMGDGTENDLMVHPDRPWMIGHIDAWNVAEEGGDFGAEIKFVQSPAKYGEWGAEGSDEVPVYYQIQCQHYMAVKGWPRWLVGVFLAGIGLRHYWLDRDEKVIAHLIEKEREFLDMVEAGTPPDPETDMDLRLRWFASTDKTVLVTPEIREALVLRERLRRERDLATERYDDVCRQIKRFMGDATVILDAHGNELVSWKQQKRFDESWAKGERAELMKKYGKLDTARLRKEEPHVYRMYVREPHDTAEQVRTLRNLRGMENLLKDIDA